MLGHLYFCTWIAACMSLALVTVSASKIQFELVFSSPSPDLLPSSDISRFKSAWERRLWEQLGGAEDQIFVTVIFVCDGEGETCKVVAGVDESMFIPPLLGTARLGLVLRVELHDHQLTTANSKRVDDLYQELLRILADKSSAQYSNLVGEFESVGIRKYEHLEVTLPPGSENDSSTVNNGSRSEESGGFKRLESAEESNSELPVGVIAGACAGAFVCLSACVVLGVWRVKHTRSGNTDKPEGKRWTHDMRLALDRPIDIMAGEEDVENVNVHHHHPGAYQTPQPPPLTGFQMLIMEGKWHERNVSNENARRRMRDRERSRKRVDINPSQNDRVGINRSRNPENQRNRSRRSSDNSRDPPGRRSSEKENRRSSDKPRGDRATRRGETPSKPKHSSHKRKKHHAKPSPHSDTTDASMGSDWDPPERSALGGGGERSSKVIKKSGGDVEISHHSARDSEVVSRSDLEFDPPEHPVGERDGVIHDHLNPRVPKKKKKKSKPKKRKPHSRDSQSRTRTHTHTESQSRTRTHTHTESHTRTHTHTHSYTPKTTRLPKTRRKERKGGSSRSGSGSETTARSSKTRRGSKTSQGSNSTSEGRRSHEHDTTGDSAKESAKESVVKRRRRKSGISSDSHSRESTKSSSKSNKASNQRSRRAAATHLTQQIS